MGGDQGLDKEREGGVVYKPKVSVRKKKRE